MDDDFALWDCTPDAATLPEVCRGALPRVPVRRPHDGLMSLDGLQSLQTIGYELSLRANAQLADVTALHGLISAPRVTIADNPVLTDAAAWALVDEIDQAPDSVGIDGNN